MAADAARQDCPTNRCAHPHRSPHLRWRIALVAASAVAAACAQGPAQGGGDEAQPSDPALTCVAEVDLYGWCVEDCDTICSLAFNESIKCVGSDGTHTLTQGWCDTCKFCMPIWQQLTACQPACVGHECGDDGCGGSCGSCGAGDYCSGEGACKAIPPPTPPCVEILPTNTLVFGAVAIGHSALRPVGIKACDDQELTLEAHLDEDSSEAFSIEPGAPTAAGTEETAILMLRYEPQAVGAPADTATVVLTIGRSDAPEVEPIERLVFLQGKALAAPIPVAILTAKEKSKGSPGSLLHLKGDESYGRSGAKLVKFQWSVTQPSGSWSTFMPDSAFPNPTFAANVVGAYLFQLTVEDDGGNQASSNWTFEATPNVALYVEVVWDAAGELDHDTGGVGNGPDLDLHFAHPDADGGVDVDGDGTNDPWFDKKYDAFWFNPKPDWNGAGSGPELMMDSSGGWGPEALRFLMPVVGKSYPIGVHGVDDHDLASLTATVRVFATGKKIFETSTELATKDFWWVGSVSWPDGKVEAKLNASGGPWLTPKYMNPGFPYP